MLPMIPVYISYFAGGETNRTGKTTFLNALFFVLGFTLVYMLLGLFAGTIGALLTEYKKYVNWVSGAVVILFGLSYLGVFRIGLFKGMKSEGSITNVFESFIFGVVFSVSLTPCVGVFLGAALMLAANQSTMLQGALLLFVYSLGIGLPFLASALIISKLKNTFDFIKRHYGIINIISGILLILLGVLMATGLFYNLLI